MGLEPSGSWNRPRINKVWAFALAWVGVLITIGSGNTHPHRSKNSYVSCLVAFYLARLFFCFFLATGFYGLSGRLGCFAHGS